MGVPEAALYLYGEAGVVEHPFQLGGSGVFGEGVAEAVGAC